jgi:hypothetical protein
MGSNDDNWQTRCVRAEISTRDFDFTQWQGCRRNNVVDTRIGKDILLRGLGAASGHSSSLVMQQRDYLLQQPTYTQSIQPRPNIVENNAPSVRKAFKTTEGKRLGDVEKPKEKKRKESGSPAEGASQQRDPLTRDFVDHDKAGIVTVALARGNCGRRNSEDD